MAAISLLAPRSLTMKGLSQFIVDIRNAQDAEAEQKRINFELNNIQVKLSSNPNAYQRKKYILKLVYIYLLGYDNVNDFGSKESIKLLSTKNFTEKQLGYLGGTVFKAEIPIEIINSDLQSNDVNTNILALQFIANNSIEGKDIIDLVYSMAVGPMSSIILKKKALLALKKLVNQKLLIENNHWIPRLLSLLDHDDISVVLNVLPIVQLIVSIDNSFISTIIDSTVAKLDTLVNGQVDEIFCYYKNPAPWLIIKLLQLLESCFLARNEPYNDNKLRQIIGTLISDGTKLVQGLQNKNIKSSILFQSVSLIIFLSPSNESILGAVQALTGLLLSAHDINTRYLSLDVLTKLLGRSSLNGEVINLNEISKFLNDRDISIKRKVLDLMYIVTNDSNYQTVISKFIDVYPSIEFSLRSELSIKIALLAENFARDSVWYVNIMIKLISLSNDTNEIWERICQIVVNNDDLRAKSCKFIMSRLGESSTPNLIKLGSFLLGEYGHLIVKEYPPEAQFKTFYSLYIQSVDVNVKIMILSVFLKMLKYFPNEPFIPEIIDIFELELDSIDLETQTRAHEYLNLVKHDKVQDFVVPLPPFEILENKLFDRIAVNKVIRTKSSSLKIQRPDQTFSPNWYNGFHRMLHFDAGIFYENQLIRIVYKIDRQTPTDFVYKFQVINLNKATKITGFKILNVKPLVAESNPNYLIKMVSSPDLNIQTKTSFDIEVNIRNPVELSEDVIVSFSFSCGGSFSNLNLKFPVNFLKTLSPTELTVQEFKSRWLQINTLLPQGEEFKETVISDYGHKLANITRLLQRLRFGIVHQEDAGGMFLVLGAGILSCQNHKYGIVLSIKNTDTTSKSFELIVKCTGQGLSRIIGSIIAEIIKQQ